MLLGLGLEIGMDNSLVFLDIGSSILGRVVMCSKYVHACIHNCGYNQLLLQFAVYNFQAFTLIQHLRFHYDSSFVFISIHFGICLGMHFRVSVYLNENRDFCIQIQLLFTLIHEDTYPKRIKMKTDTKEDTY